jgi:anti-sigma B factor antagonist
MAIKEKIINDVAVLTISGQLMGGEETAEVHEKVKSILSGGVKNVVINLEKVNWMNSSGLGTLMACHTTITNARGLLKLAQITDKVHNLFLITQLVRIFDIHPSVDAAVASFTK